MPRIVVGVDGSPESRAALHWAVAEARLRGAELHAVHVWSVPIVPGREFAPTLAIPTDELRDEARALVDSLVAEALEGAEDVKVTPVVVQGNPAELLVEAGRGADLLVVGSRGHGGFAGMLLGSVSAQCAHHAVSPLVIVRRGVVA